MEANVHTRPAVKTVPDAVFGKRTGQRLNDASSIGSKVAAANQEFYRQVSSKYDQYETGMSDPVIQRILEEDLDKIGSHFVSLRRPPSCLDCGGGTGNVALKMCARGWTVTVVDVSSEMLDLLKEKARIRGYSPTLIRAPIEQFFESSPETFDFVAFSAVLHHLYSYTSVVQQAVSRVCSGGIFYSNNDPVVPKLPTLTWAFDSLDIAFGKLIYNSEDVLPGIRRRLRKLFSPRDPSVGRRVVSPGDIAEYHARTGVSDEEIIRLLQKNEFEIVERQRYTTGRTTPIRVLNKRLRLLESFKIIARRASCQNESDPGGIAKVKDSPPMTKITNILPPRVW
ncbi:MAG TPA: methyltransferase domain-containing protein [Candidatus Acidoferrum sp.]|nr:methyltransferase domain-containing protein [Candidatus Acidoferrum sp.]